MSNKHLFAAVISGIALLSSVAASEGAPARPNIVLILADDLGFSDISPYGGEIRTPNLEKLAAKGVRFTEFYNAARCCPSRASLLTGLYQHQAHVGDMVDEYARRVREQLNSPAYSDRLNPHAPTIAEALGASGYRTFMSGKWHLGYRTNEWPAARGFDRSFSVIEGAMNYYGFGIQHTGIITNPPMALDDKVFLPPREGFFATDAFTDHAVRFIEEEKKNSDPFFLYLAYTAPHWPLHAKPETIARYRGKYKKIGWDKLREQRFSRLKKAGIIDGAMALVPRPPNVVPWDEATPEQQDKWDHEMAIYAAQTEEMDYGIGEVLKALKKTGRDKNTLILFMSDNGGASEDPNRSLPGAVLGGRDSYEGYGMPGAHVSSSPFRKVKKYSHEGGISSPLIMHWPVGIAKRQHGKVLTGQGHIIDVMPTFLEVAGAEFPKTWKSVSTTPLEGISLSPAFSGKPLSRSTPLFWEHEGHRAIRDGKWKLVSSFNEPWELYDMEADRVETKDLAKIIPQITRDLTAKYEAWADRVGAKPWPMPEKRPPPPQKK
ncbi:MAG: arylsulfatase [Verrucomicrobia bacterium]|nr:arylsulfatase [Verrucomicrobiota bacterium]